MSEEVNNLLYFTLKENVRIFEDILSLIYLHVFSEYLANGKDLISFQIFKFIGLLKNANIPLCVLISFLDLCPNKFWAQYMTP